jgi:glycosyltransferase involved in cell wall biosynthesis
LKPKISIVTPNYNGVLFLEETIKSVINQGYDNLEYIIIDGGSNDGSVDIIKKYEKHLAYWVSEPDGGLYHAIQKGFEKCTGEIMAWINSDDIYHKGALEIVAEIFSRFDNIKWLQGLPNSIDEKGRSVYLENNTPWCKAKFLSQWSVSNLNYGEYKWIQQESTFWHRDLWNKAGGFLNTKLKYAGDFELWLRFFRYEELFTINALIGSFRLRKSNQLSLDHKTEYIDEVIELLNKEFNSLPKGYIEKINSVLMFDYTMNQLKSRIKRSLYFRKYFKMVEASRNELFIYPKTIQFDRMSQQFALH